MINEKVIEKLREYIKNHYVPLGALSIVGQAAIIGSANMLSFRTKTDEAERYIKENKDAGGFPYALERKREEKGLTPAELYKKAGIDRRQYSRYLGPERRHPSMSTAICFVLALHLNRQETDEFLQTAGYALSYSSSRDICIMYCLKEGIYDIDEINTLLFAIGIEPLRRE